MYAESTTGGSVNVFDSTISGNGCLTQTAADCVGGLRIHETGSPDVLLLVNSTVSGNEGHGLSFGEAGGFSRSRIVSSTWTSSSTATRPRSLANCACTSAGFWVKSSSNGWPPAERPN